jgi:EAL domain-containing protein (putative c-di-GMP-specific phosphodiesterase class I)
MSRLTVLEQAIRRAADPIVLMKRVAEEALNLSEEIDGALVGFVHDPEWVTFECGAGLDETRVGTRVPVHGSLAGLAFQTAKTVVSDDARADLNVNRTFSNQTGIRSLVCIPLWRRSETVGVFCVASRRLGAFSEADVATIKGLADFISVVLALGFDLANVTETLLSEAERSRTSPPARLEEDREAEERFVANVLSPGTLHRIERRDAIDDFLNGDGLSHLFQPIFDIKSGLCVAVEALARFAGPQPLRSPDFWFAEAQEMGVGVDLELVSVKLALRCLRRLPVNMDLCVNAGPETIASDQLRELLAASTPERIVVELTEQVKVEDYTELSRALESMYAMGVRLAIDDTGAGFASLSHILKLAPNFIKLDRELTSGIDRDPVRVTLANALVSFAGGLGAEIVAEGIETETEFQMLRDLGIRYGQGFYLFRPTSLESIPTRLPADSLRLSDIRRAHKKREGRLLAFPH